MMSVLFSSASEDSDWFGLNAIEQANGIPDDFWRTKHIHILDNP